MESLGAEEADVRSADGEEIKAQEAESCERVGAEGCRVTQALLGL